MRAPLASVLALGALFWGAAPAALGWGPVGRPLAAPAVFRRWPLLTAASPIRLEVAIEVAGRAHPIRLSEEGFAEAARILGWLFPGQTDAGEPALTGSGTWAVLQKLSEPAFEAEFVRIADLSSRKTFRLTIVADDDPERPMTAFVRTVDGVREIRFGENRIQRDGELESFLPVMLHEVGHVADDTGCRLDYGPDGSHSSYEILNPGAAFKEGWGDYLGGKLPGYMMDFSRSPRPMAVEGSVGGQGRAGVYLTIEEPDLEVNDYLSNEAWVARILLDLEALAPGRAGVERVFVATNRGGCRHLAGFLAAWVKSFPDTREAVLGILRHRLGEAGSEEDYAKVLEGELLGRLDPEDLPRPRDYRPGTSDGPGWLERMLDRIRDRFPPEPGPAAGLAEPGGGMLGTGD